jgi:hypothetical protein
MKTMIIIETPDDAEETSSEIARDYASLIRESAADNGTPVTVTEEAYEVREESKP